MAQYFYNQCLILRYKTRILVLLPKQYEFKLTENKLRFHDVDLMQLVEKYGAPLKFTYLPQISNNIQRAKKWFNDAIEKHDYKVYKDSL